MDNSADGAVQVPASNEEVSTLHLSAVADAGDNGGDNSCTDLHVSDVLSTAVACSSLLADQAQVLDLQRSATDQNVLDHCEQKGGSQDKSADVCTTSVKPIQDKLFYSDDKLESSATKFNETICEPTSEDDVTKNCVAAVNCMHTSPHISSQVSSSSPNHMPVVNLSGMPSQRFSSSAELVDTKNCSGKVIANADHSGPFVTGSGETALSASSDVIVRSERQDSETGAPDLSTLKNITVELSPVKDQCCETNECPVNVSMITVDAESSHTQFENQTLQKKVAESDGCTMSSPRDIAIKISAVKAECCKTDERPVEDPALMIDSQYSPINSKNPIPRLESEAKTELCTYSSRQNTAVEISAGEVQWPETDKCPVQSPAVDAQNSPIPCLTSRSIGSSPLKLPTSPAAIALNSDTRPVRSVDCLVQTSVDVIDRSCSPLPCAVTRSVACSPIDVKTETATTSPILFVPAIGCSVQTEPWMIDVDCSPMTPPYCDGYCLTSAQTSPQRCSSKSTKYNTASFSTDRPQSQRMADGTSPSLRCENLLPAHGEELCRKLSTAGSASSYATPSGVACNCDEEDPPRLAAATDCSESGKGSTPPHSCEELFDDSSQRSYTSPSSVAHQPCGIYPSQLPLESSHETQNSNTQPVEFQDPTDYKLSDDSYSLESSQVCPKCSSDEEESKEVKSNHSENDTYSAAV